MALSVDSPRLPTIPLMADYQDVPRYERTGYQGQAGYCYLHGTVDANLDRGWLMQPPQMLKPYCRGCDRWHDTQAEVDRCIATQEAKLAEAQNKARAR